jgi:hypothetical protein
LEIFRCRFANKWFAEYVAPTELENLFGWFLQRCRAYGAWELKSPSITSICIRRAVKQCLVMADVIPGFIADVMGKGHVSSANICGTEYNTIGCESINNAIINAQNIGARLLGEVKSENLLFVFGQTVQSLQSTLREFTDEHLAAYPAKDCYGSIYTEKDTRKNKHAKEISAVVLRKIINSKFLQPLVGTE